MLPFCGADYHRIILCFGDSFLGCGTLMTLACRATLGWIFIEKMKSCFAAAWIWASQNYTKEKKFQKDLFQIY